MKKVYDVAIVGAGPVGLNVARILSEKGYEIIVVDKKNDTSEKVVCTGIVGPSLLRYLKLPGELILNEIRRVNLISPFGTIIQYIHPETLAYIIDREKFDAFLAQCAVKSGAQIKLSFFVKDIDISGQYVKIKAEGKEEEIMAKIIVLATGPEIDLLKKIGLGYPSHFLNAIQTVFELSHDSSITIFTGSEISKGAFGWLAPKGDSTVKIGLMTEDNPVERLAFLTKKISLNGHSAFSLKRIPQGLVSKTFKDKVLSVGGCAGQVKTTTGGGIYFGFLCGEIVAEVISSALKKGSFDAYTFSEYEKKWKKMVGKEIKAGIYLRKIWKRLSDKEIEKLFQFIESHGLLDCFAQKGHFDWHASFFRDLFFGKKFRNIFKAVFDF